MAAPPLAEGLVASPLGHRGVRAILPPNAANLRDTENRGAEQHEQADRRKGQIAEELVDSRGRNQPWPRFPAILQPVRSCNGRNAAALLRNGESAGQAGRLHAPSRRPSVVPVRRLQTSRDRPGRDARQRAGSSSEIEIHRHSSIFPICVAESWLPSKPAQRPACLVEAPFHGLCSDRQQRRNLIDTGFFEIVHQHHLALPGGQSLDGLPQALPDLRTVRDQTGRRPAQGWPVRA